MPYDVKDSGPLTHWLSVTGQKMAKIDETVFPVTAGNCMFKVNNRNLRTKCEICSKLIIKTGVFIVDFEHISHLVLVFLLLNLNM